MRIDIASIDMVSEVNMVSLKSGRGLGMCVLLWCSVTPDGN